VNIRIALAGLAAATAITLGVALAHANIKSSIPKDGSSLSAMPKTVQLTFGEAVETKVSTFKIYWMDEKLIMKNGKELPDEQADDIVEKFANKMTALKQDTADRVDAGYSKGTMAQAKQVTLNVKPGTSKPGVYVVMWKLTSVDTHTTSGFMRFALEKK
jgi:methionine-rich copper-binding protein CopC